MKIAIDCRSLRKKPAGVPNFLLSVINTLAIQKPDWTIYLLSNETLDETARSRLSSSANVILIISPLWPFSKLAILWYLVKVPILIAKLHPDIFYSPIPNLPFGLPRKVRTLITVHDMVFKHFPGTMSRANWWINFLLHNRSIRQADLIWAVSQYTKGEIELLFPIRKCKEILMGASVDKTIFHPTVIKQDLRKSLFAKYGLTGKFLLFVGTLEPRKNLSFLLSLMPDLAQRGYTLMVVGPPGWGGHKESTGLRKQEKEFKNVIFTGFIPNDELVRLYQIASVYVSVALNEGFGLPQLEAMCCGCPVVSPHNSAMIEVVEGAGETVPGWDPKEWIDVILKVCDKRDNYAARGLERSKFYDWTTVISNMVRYVQ